MSWIILLALVPPLLHSISNILDNYLASQLSKNVWTICFYSSLFNCLFLPIVFIIARPQLPPWSSVPSLLIIALIEVLYLYPYYKALQHDDTSVVTSLFDLGKIFIPLLAFLMVGEKLALVQYVGFFIIIVGSTLLATHRHGHLRVNIAFFYMFVCSLLLSLQAVLYKSVFEQVDWSTGFIWPTILSFILVLGLLLIKKQRHSIKAQFKNFKNKISIFFLEELCTFGGSAVAVYVISRIPVTLEEGIESFQPIFVLLAALLLKPFFPKLFREHTDHHSIEKKVILFAAMILGGILVVR